MNIKVQVKPQAKKESVTVEADGTYTVRVHAPPFDGQANSRVQQLLALFFKIPKSSVTLLKGKKSKIKTFHILF